MSMPYTPMHLSQHGLVQAGLTGMGPSPDALQRSFTAHLASMSGGYKLPNSQVTFNQLLRLYIIGLFSFSLIFSEKNVVFAI